MMSWLTEGMGKKHPGMTVKVGPVDYRVEYVKQLKTDHDLFGVTLPQQQKIYIDANVPLQTGQDTLLHEVLHAVFDIAGLNIEMENGARVEEEQIIRRITPWLLQVLKENPELIETLLK